MTPQNPQKIESGIVESKTFQRIPWKNNGDRLSTTPRYSNMSLGESDFSRCFRSDGLCAWFFRKPLPVEHRLDTLRGVPQEVDSVSCFGVEGGGR